MGVESQVRTRALHHGHRSALDRMLAVTSDLFDIEPVHRLHEDPGQRTQQRALVREPATPRERKLSTHCRSPTSGSFTRITEPAHTRCRTLLPCVRTLVNHGEVE